jgi:NAD(P)-dependent dehydrogenase (short-subunit alcohol dehydrogenase family)
MLQGANGAIGQAACRLIAESIPGSHVILAGRDYAKVEAVANNIKNNDNIKGTISAVQLDLTDSTSIEEAATYVQDKFGRLDVLVNNAASGFTPGTILHQIEQQVKVNTLGPAAVAESFNPLLLKSSNPYSIFISSAIGSLAMAKEFGGAIVNEMWVPHRISKSALNMFVIMEDKFQGPKGSRSLQYARV